MGGRGRCDRPHPSDPLARPAEFLRTPTHTKSHQYTPKRSRPDTQDRKKGVHSGCGMVKTIQVSDSELKYTKLLTTRRIVESELSFVAAAQMLSGISRPRPRRTKPTLNVSSVEIHRVPSNVATEWLIQASICSVSCV